MTNGQLTWTATSGGRSLVFDSGYYQYTPPPPAPPAVSTAAAVTTLFNAGDADDNGVG